MQSLYLLACTVCVDIVSYYNFSSCVVALSITSIPYHIIYYLHTGIHFATSYYTFDGCLFKTLSYYPFTNDPVCEPVSMTLTVSPSDAVIITQLNASTYNVSGLADIVYTIKWTGVHDGHLFLISTTTGKFTGDYCCTCICTSVIHICIYCPVTAVHSI